MVINYVKSCKTKLNFHCSAIGQQNMFIDQYEAFLHMFSSHVVFVFQKLVLFKRKFAVLLRPICNRTLLPCKKNGYFYNFALNIGYFS